MTPFRSTGVIEFQLRRCLKILIWSCPQHGILGKEAKSHLQSLRADFVVGPNQGIFLVFAETSNGVTICDLV